MFNPSGESADRLRIRRLEVMGCRIRTATLPGDRARPPLLMLNGMGAPLEILIPLAESLDGIEVVLFDIPGIGESSMPQIPYTLPQLASATGRILTQLDYHSADVFGLSWGGMLAQQFAFQNPRRCHRLILAATMPGTPMIPGPLSVLGKVASPRRFNDPEYAKRIAPKVYGGAARTAPLPPFEMQARGTSRRGYLFQQLAVIGWGSHLMLPLLRQRTLILAGDDDPIAPLANARWMAQLIRHSRLHVLHDGHHFFRSSLDETSATIRDFLQKSE